MPAAFARFSAVARDLAPRTAVVLGSGLGGVTAGFREAAAVSFGDVPGLAPTTVGGHAGRLAVGDWSGSAVLLYFGRLHFYEGHPAGVVTGPTRVAAGLGVRRFVQTNAAGGIHPSLAPGALMAVREHLAFFGRDAWRASPAGRGGGSPYSAALLRVMRDHEAASGRELFAGVYAAVTGPCYETPAEIRALRACGADAVGMSTAREADAAAALGLEVAAVSCVTNRAAGLGDGPLDHAEVLRNAKLGVERLAGLLEKLIEA